MAAAPILVVDDEAALRRLLRLYLAKEGHSVLEAATGPDGLAVIRRGSVCLALIDVMLPGFDGYELVRRARQESSIPIIMLTARGEETSRVIGLEVGADDYVVKPFSAPEVIARVRAQLRRATSFQLEAAPVSVGRLALDRIGHRCLVDGATVALTRREFDLLEVLLRHVGRAYTREQLLSQVWGSSWLSTKTVDVHIAGLRRKLGEAVNITALRSVGYRLDR